VSEYVGITNLNIKYEIKQSNNEIEKIFHGRTKENQNMMILI